MTRLGILMGVILILGLAALAAPAQGANGQAVVRPDPLSLGLRAGEQGSISLRVETPDPMYGVELHLVFDPAVVEVVDADASKPDAQLKPGDWLKNAFVAVNKADNQSGRIDYAVTLLNPAPPVSGSGVLATITFKAKKDGTSPLRIEKAILATREAKEIKSVWQNGAIGVSSSGRPPEVQAQPSGGSSGGQPPAAPSGGFLGLNLPQWALVGAAGLGVVAFLGALLVLGIAIVWRMRR